MERAEAENVEVNLIQEYLPEPLSEEALEKLIEEVFAQFDNPSIKDMKTMIDKLKSMSEDRVDMSILSKKLKSRLT